MQTASLDEFNAEATRFASLLARGEKATVIALSGNLGAGKTTFTQAVAAHFGIQEQVASPTFVIEKIYPIRDASRSHGASPIADAAFARLIHIDAYRLKSAQELEALGWQELLEDADNLILIEWPERVAELIPESAHRIMLTFIDEDTRTIDYGEKDN